VDALEEKKGENIVLLDLRGLADFADFFILCNGTSERMLHALADAALDQARLKHAVRGRSEGGAAAGWVLVDFGDVVLHLFSPDRRKYYRIEELWSQAKVLLQLQ
jgi:ribosome-associated protein